MAIGIPVRKLFLLLKLILSLCSLAGSCGGNHVWLHLEVQPNPVFEGDTLTLQCREGKNAALSQVKFYKDGEVFHFSKASYPLWRGTATMKSSGLYSCSGQVTHVPQQGTQTSGTVNVQVWELFPPPLLNAVPSPELHEGSQVTLKCQTRLHPQRSASRLRFSFHKDDHILKHRGFQPELQISRAKEKHSGLYWCEVVTDNGRVRKQSPGLEIRVQEPVSRPLLILPPGATGPVAGDVVELLCEAQTGSPLILYPFYLNEKILGNCSAPQGGDASLLFPVTSEQDAGNYFCETENRISRERSEPKKLTMDGPQVLSTPSHPKWLVLELPLGLLGLMVIAAALLGYFRPWRRAEHHQNEKDEGVTYSVVYTAPKKRKGE
ncbi:Fc receptor-like protein 6 [Dasypus novemcinctus]|uniref:Fc receptor-like protein 6 n=1 Tax=Dasypus novemcinctus TaxID=9361 RepID=UPI00265FEE25|nr:Fc receptor-like protein 6 [Dasypus novemcinctus]